MSEEMENDKSLGEKLGDIFQTHSDEKDEGLKTFYKFEMIYYNKGGKAYNFSEIKAKTLPDSHEDMFSSVNDYDYYCDYYETEIDRYCAVINDMITQFVGYDRNHELIDMARELLTQMLKSGLVILENRDKEQEARFVEERNN